VHCNVRILNGKTVSYCKARVFIQTHATHSYRTQRKRLHCVRCVRCVCVCCVNENASNASALLGASMIGCFDRPFLLAGACVRCVKNLTQCFFCLRNFLAFIAFLAHFFACVFFLTQDLACVACVGAFEWKLGLTVN